MNGRRKIIGGLGLGLVGLCEGGLAAAIKDRCRGAKRELLDEGALIDLPPGGIDDGARGDWDIPDAIRRNFQRVIEQNFSIQDGPGTIAIVQTLNERELDALANIYQRVSLNGGRPARLLGLLAERADEVSLGKISKSFGFSPVYLAAHATSPRKAELALPYLNRQAVGPRLLLGEYEARHAYNENNLDYTVKEIYLNYRTAPVGSMSVTAAMYETAMYAGTRLLGSFGAGYTLGTMIQQTWQNYSPQTWGQFSDFLGSRIDGFVNGVGNILGSVSWNNATSAMMRSVGELQKLMWGQFNRPAYQSVFERKGGDYDVTRAWREQWQIDSCK